MHNPDSRMLAIFAEAISGLPEKRSLSDAGISPAMLADAMNDVFGLMVLQTVTLIISQTVLQHNGNYLPPSEALEQALNGYITSAKGLVEGDVTAIDWTMFPKTVYHVLGTRENLSLFLVRARELVDSAHFAFPA